MFAASPPTRISAVTWVHTACVLHHPPAHDSCIRSPAGYRRLRRPVLLVEHASAPRMPCTYVRAYLLILQS
jgi:hypothetical protein